jgi:hypothetical protein
MQPEQLAEIVGAAIEAATTPLLARIAALEKAATIVGRDGRDGQSVQGPQGIPGPQGPQGERGPEGLPGASIQGPAGENGLDGKDGENGRDGLHGLGFDDLTVTYDGEQTITMVYERGVHRKEFPIHLPIPVHRGKWDAGRVYKVAEEVMWAGSTWRAIEETKAEPGTPAAASRAWIMVSRRGDVGKTGQKGLAGDRGERGSEGPRGPQGY